MTPPAPPSSISVLVVEDDAAMRAHVTGALGARGYRVLEAAHGLAALRTLAEHGPPFVLVLDLDTPLLNGARLLQELRRFAQLRSGLAVVVFSGTPPAPALDLSAPVVATVRKDEGLGALLAAVESAARTLQGRLS